MAFFRICISPLTQGRAEEDRRAADWRCQGGGEEGVQGGEADPGS